MDKVDLRTISWDEFLTSGQTTIILVLASNNVDLSSQFANTEMSSFCLHRPYSKKTVFNWPAQLPFNNLPWWFWAFSDDIKTVVSFIKDRVWNTLPLVVIFLWEIYESGNIWKYLFLNFLRIFAQSVEYGFRCFISKKMEHVVIWGCLLRIESKYFF